jgi:hypothetical protein
MATDLKKVLQAVNSDLKALSKEADSLYVRSCERDTPARYAHQDLLKGGWVAGCSVSICHISG